MITRARDAAMPRDASLVSSSVLFLLDVIRKMLLLSLSYLFRCIADKHRKNAFEQREFILQQTDTKSLFHMLISLRLDVCVCGASFKVPTKFLIGISTAWQPMLPAKFNGN